ncbi:S-adenosyl-L-methionine-dependent methyltransferase [Cryphonectria parasitica EP155]|uniref:S-adenosyl-L-methionine-dependent methyltransferase n=1 Tax=Cryphonectria parasitica (strain ATCC 38755 / EP155) TaxID=660469 RepID=A0A9P4XV57_CRYP1|nr:S-adenosyl-L-methionine-dependent methyltransferase [Cryphonectria parasitica EP155]KAF3761335.1 S-adenosyl-L-methionine-dependent methyltransferase [Cryphonectria parasitica EP155]
MEPRIFQTLRVNIKPLQREALPKGTLENELLDSALGDCKGLTVLDVGGGQGVRARQVVDHGAVAVDVLDLSPEMMQIGKEVEETLGRGSKVVQWFEVDVSKPEDVERLPLRFKDEGYDLVMANWTFEHASSMEMLDGMFRTIVAYLKPGGRFIGTRVFNSPRTPETTSGKYGAVYKDFVDVPGGMLFRYVVSVDPPVEYDAASMEVTHDPAKIDEFHARHGLVDTQVEPAGEAPCVKSDPDFWKTFLELPSMAVVKARKAKTT